MTEGYKILPITVKYKDKINLAYKLLNIYSVMIQPLTNRNISLLVICLLEDINGDNFDDIVINSNIGITNSGHVRTEMSRLKDKGLLVKHEIINRKDLSPSLQKIAKLLNDNEKLALHLVFDITK